MIRPAWALLLLAACGGTVQPGNARELVRAGDDAAAQRDYRTAIEHYDRAVGAGGGPEVFYKRGICYLALGEADAAADSFHQAIQYGGKALEVKARNMLANAYAVRGDFAAAARELERVMGTPADLRDSAVATDSLQYRLGVLYMRLGKWDDGKRLLQQALGTGPVSVSKDDIDVRMSLKTFAVQVGPFKTETLARAQMKSMSARTVTKLNGEYFVIREGFATYEEAQAAVQSLKERGAEAKALP